MNFARCVFAPTNFSSFEAKTLLPFFAKRGKTSELSFLFCREMLKEQKSIALKEKKESLSFNISFDIKLPSSFSEVKLYFEERNFPFEEAEKFFNYYETNAWLTTAKMKMRNWQAAAQNWMIKSQKLDLQSELILGIKKS